MAELTLYPTEYDELPIVDLAFQLGCKLILDLNYPTAEYQSLSTLEEYKRYRASTRLFFLLSEQFFCSPLEMRRIEKDGKTVYYIADSGGPLIHFLGGGLFEEAGSKFIRPSSIGHHSRYENNVSHAMEKPPSQLVETYKALQKLIRRSFRHSKPGKVSFWVGPQAVQAVQNGAKLVGFEKYSAQQLFG